jgi:hypothetical protein
LCRHVFCSCTYFCRWLFAFRLWTCIWLLACVVELGTKVPVRVNMFIFLDQVLLLVYWSINYSNQWLL